MKTVEQVLWVFVVWLTAALIGYFCWQAGRKYGQNEVLESLAKANCYTDDCIESEEVTIKTNRFEGGHDYIIEYPNADVIVVTNPCPINGCFFKDGEGIW